MKDRVCRVIANVLNVNESDLDYNSSPDNIEEWDSLKHMNVVLTLEQEFGVQFNDEQMMSLLSVELIVETLKEMGVKF